MMASAPKNVTAQENTPQTAATHKLFDTALET